MTLIEFRSYFRVQLKDVYVLEECDDFLKRLIQAYFKWEPIKIGLDPNYKLSSIEEEKLKLALIELKKERPLQYILGTAYFVDLELEVNTAVLIPRPETEELVHWILSDEDKLNPLTILDIGTGSGCIAISLKKTAQLWNVAALDVSEQALDVAYRNASKNEVSIQFHLEDILDKKQWLIPLDVIVSNPPYVVPSEKEQMLSNVLDYEPDLALFVPEEDPLLFYKRIIEFAHQNLKPSGALYFEINPIFVDELVTFFKKFTFDSVEVRNDYLNRPRMIKAIKSTI
ncbi:peptide chain release factor N(5)-glutamine methyltransferase [Flavobacteriaceae bacterium]|nr:peptide chain release factor N(5)-glutamine methyltransferase [Flavobacteriaceae bacterium]